MLKVCELKKKINTLYRLLRILEKEKRLAEINKLIEQKDELKKTEKDIDCVALYKEKEVIQKHIREYFSLEQRVQDLIQLESEIKDDYSFCLEVEEEAAKLEADIKAVELTELFVHCYDSYNAVLVLNAGQGGIDAQDFTEILFRMYTKYAEKKGYRVDIINQIRGDEAGLKSISMIVSGKYAYGFLKAEVGVHRLVRISPFDSGARRHTSFVSVWLAPEVEEEQDIRIDLEDIKIDTFKSGGAGGQHVNKTESAVRIYHIPTGLSVACQVDRSQLRNRVMAMKLLKAKLWDLKNKEREVEKRLLEGQKKDASFGSQIRNYVLTPYRVVKDLRTQYETGNVDAVFGGEIQAFIDLYLIQDRLSEISKL
ncbi:MAG: peptide chain release factor 2 [Deltaproteobacteria bacterium]|nr:MAG: peptide chain release factor 2 [Deltaproteobacteria bacterium]